MSTFQVICWDLDGVLRRWPAAQTRARALERQHGLPEGAIDAAAFEPALFERAMTGRILDETWRLATRNALARAHGVEPETAAAVVEAWSALTGEIDAEVVDLVKRWRGRVHRTVLLTNATTRLEDDLRRERLDPLFDVIVSSARTGFAKPDARIYRVAAARAGRPPAACIVIDDQPANVEAAAAAGMTAVLYEGAPALCDRIDALLGG